MSAMLSKLNVVIPAPIFMGINSSGPLGILRIPGVKVLAMAQEIYDRFPVKPGMTNALTPMKAMKKYFFMADFESEQSSIQNNPGLLD